MTQSALTLADLVFFGTAGVTVACALYAVLARNIVRAVFSLLGTFFGVAVLYAMLSADFVAVVQLLVYVGGILVLMLFAVMLTSNIESAASSSRSGSLITGVLAGGALLIILVTLALQAPWSRGTGAEFAPTTASLGETLLGPALVPFELLGLLLLGVVVGAVVVARLPKEKGS